MHIPDGYLSPSTCAALYAAAAPFWYGASRKLNGLVGTRLVPRIALVAAFSFVLMMFNIPLPAGTSGHAVGMGIAAVTLGPWASILAISVALLIQALFFGDGGVLAYGANAFNLAIVGSLVASWVYRAIARDAETTSTRRVVASSLAGYLAINASALVTAVELGLQPLLFHDSSGTPLYAPYPLTISIPAMMLGHLTIAGFAEATVCGGIVAYLQRSDPALLGDARVAPRSAASLRALWIGLAVFLLATPLGLLTVGTAWGEWAPEDFHDPDSRQAIVAASGGAEPAMPSSHFEHLASVWTAPFPDYAPPMLRNPALGYALSGMFGTGLVILVVTAIGWLSRSQRLRDRES